MEDNQTYDLYLCSYLPTTKCYCNFAPQTIDPRWSVGASVNTTAAAAAAAAAIAAWRRRCYLFSCLSSHQTVDGRPAHPPAKTVARCAGGGVRGKSSRARVALAGHAERARSNIVPGPAPLGTVPSGRHCFRTGRPISRENWIKFWTRSLCYSIDTSSSRSSSSMLRILVVKGYR